MGGGISVEVKEQPLDNWKENDEEKYNRLYGERVKRVWNVYNYKDAKWRIYGPLSESNRLDFTELEKKLDEAEKFISGGEKERKLQELEKFIEKVKLLPIYCWAVRDDRGIREERKLHKNCYPGSCRIRLYFPDIAVQRNSPSANITDIEKYKNDVINYIKWDIRPTLKSEFFCPLSDEEIDAITDIDRIASLHTKYMERKAKFKVWLCRELDNFVL